MPFRNERKKMNRRTISALWVFLAAFAYGAEPVKTDEGFKTKNVIIVVADGERFSETWGDPAHAYIPKTAALIKDGVVFSAFTNRGMTVTVPGHTAIATGFYEKDMENGGKDIPSQPSVLQVWLNQVKTNSSAAWIICSKSKLRVLGNTTQADWKDLCLPSVNCADRDDNETYKIAIEKLRKDHPRMALINFSAPDKKGHGGNFTNYVEAIREVDGYIADLWQNLQKDPFYTDQTTLFIVNDHGRHLNDNFKNHGCDCEGCRHIMLMAIGPDFKKGEVISTPAEQIDVPVTAAKLMGCTLPISKGRVLTELFNNAPAAKKPVREEVSAPTP